MSLQGKEGRRLVPHTKYHFTISANAGSAKDFKIFVFIHGLEEVSATYFFSQFFFCGNFPIFKIGWGERSELHGGVSERPPEFSL